MQVPEWPEGGKSPGAFMARFPAGTPSYEGMTAPQAGLDGKVYPGGTPQVLISDPWDVGDIVKEWRLD